MVRNTDTSTVAPNQIYMVKSMNNNNRGVNNIQWLDNNVIYCESVNNNDIHCCNTAVDALNVDNLELPCPISHSHHFSSHLYLFP